jgi:hypothetical protein
MSDLREIHTEREEAKMKKLALSLMVLGVFGFTDAYAATKATKAKKPPPTAAFAQAAAPKAPAKDPMCKVLVPDNQFGSQREHYRCFK